MPIKANVYNQNGEQAGEMDLSQKIFGVEANEALIHQAVVAQMANERQVLAHTKIKSEVRGGGKKPWAQKGTGRARAGSSRSPLWIGGGITFGPRKNRNFKKKINKKMKQKAIMMVLSDRVASNNFAILDKLEINEYKTKVFDKIVKTFESKILPNKAEGENKDKRSVLVINDKKDEKVKFSGRNLAGVEIMNKENINIVDLLKYKNLIIVKEAVKKIEEIYNK